MSLLDVLRSGIKLADKITKPLQSDVTYYRASRQDGYGAPTLGTGVPLKAIVDFRSVPTRDSNGITVYSSATLTLLDAAAVVSATNGEGVDVDDIFVLADGTKGKVLSIGGFMDAGTEKPIPLTVMLG